ncbi:MAG: DUF3883 domain-containing protein [Fimbriimonadaceae bacterium]|nr:DUF3883 domain-containing protein [Fimbriimonadaceae bacterium]
MSDQTEGKTPIDLLMCAYALSRFDEHLLGLIGLESRSAAFGRVAQAFGSKATTVKGWRDEFDPLTPSRRVGWHGREPKPRIKALAELWNTWPDGLILDRVLEVLAQPEAPPTGPENADALGPRRRLATGLAAEEFFQENSLRIVGISPPSLIDCRSDLLGYDFRHLDGRELFEIKAVSGLAGHLLFTDRELRTAAAMGADYKVIVIGNLEDEPAWRLIADPVRALAPFRLQTTRSIAHATASPIRLPAPA